jgi:hypothetical protein
MTNSQTNTVPNTTSRLNAFTGIARRKNRFRLLPANGDGSTLTLDFTTGVLDPRLTFTRASTTATYINSSGYVTTAGTDVPRFDHDPTTLAPRGLLVEGQATNLLNWSASFATSGGTNNNWADTSITRTTGQADPANGTTAIRFTASAGNATVISSAAIGTSAARTFSVWLRRVTGTGNIQYTQNNGTNWTTQAITATWTRYTFTHTVDHRVGIRIVTSGDVIEMWGAQLETGSGASSYIPTGASQATRVQDLVSITSTNFSSWWTSNNPASFLVDVSSTNRPLANHIFRMADSSGSAYGYQSYFNSTTMPMQVRAAMSSTASSDVAIGSNLAANTRTKIGFTVETASLKRFRDGSLANTLNTPTLPPNMLTQMYIGGTSTFGNSSADFHIRQFKYWPITLSDAVMQGLTT